MSDKARFWRALRRLGQAPAEVRDPVLAALEAALDILLDLQEYFGEAHREEVSPEEVGRILELCQAGRAPEALDLAGEIKARAILGQVFGGEPV